MANNYLRYKYRLLTGASYRALYVFVDDVKLRTELVAQSVSLAGVDTAVLVTCTENYDVCMDAARALGFHLQISHAVASEIEAAVWQTLRTGIHVDMWESIASGGKLSTAKHAGGMGQSYAVSMYAAAGVLRQAFYLAMGVEISESLVTFASSAVALCYAGAAFGEALLFCYADAASIQTLEALIAGTVAVHAHGYSKPDQRITGTGQGKGILKASPRFAEPLDARARSHSLGELTATVMTMLRGFFTASSIAGELTVAPRAGPAASRYADAVAPSEAKVQVAVKLLSYLLCRIRFQGYGETEARLDEVAVLPVFGRVASKLRLGSEVYRDGALAAESAETLQGKMRTVATLTRPSVLADYDDMFLAELDDQTLDSMSLVEI